MMQYNAVAHVASSITGKQVLCNVVDKWRHCGLAVAMSFPGFTCAEDRIAGAGVDPCFTPTEARKLADALYKAAQECEQEIATREAAKREEAERAERMKVPLIRDPDGFVGGLCNYPLWFIARGGEVLGYFSPEESARDYVWVSGAQLCDLDIGPITAARHRAFAGLLDIARSRGV